MPCRTYSLQFLVSGGWRFTCRICRRLATAIERLRYFPRSVSRVARHVFNVLDVPDAPCDTRCHNRYARCVLRLCARFPRSRLTFAACAPPLCARDSRSLPYGPCAHCSRSLLDCRCAYGLRSYGLTVLRSTVTVTITITALLPSRSPFALALPSRRTVAVTRSRSGLHRLHSDAFVCVEESRLLCLRSLVADLPYLLYVVRCMVQLHVSLVASCALCALLPPRHLCFYLAFPVLPA